MENIVAAVASSHAFAVVPPERWGEVRERNRKSCVERYGTETPVHPRVGDETWDDIKTRYGRVQNDFTALQPLIEESRPEGPIVIADDRDENVSDQNFPQFAIYRAGEAVIFYRLMREPGTYPCDTETSRTIIDGAVEAGVDVSICESFPENGLISLAHAEQLMRMLLPEADLPIVPIFANAIHWHGPTPAQWPLAEAQSEQPAKITSDGAHAAAALRAVPLCIAKEQAVGMFYGVYTFWSGAKIYHRDGQRGS